MFLETYLAAETLMGVALGASELVGRAVDSRPTSTGRKAPAKARSVQLAEQALHRFWNQQSLPVDVLRIAKGCRVTLASAQLADGIGAVIARDGETGLPTVTLSTAFSAVGQRYALTHALGLLLLGDRETTEVTRTHFKTGTTLPLARQANQFALHLLIPTYGLEFMLSRGHKVEKFADIYMVSPAAMGERIIKHAGY